MWRVLGWCLTLGLGGVVLANALGIGDPWPVPIVYSFVPYLVWPLALLVAVANARREWTLALTNGTALVVLLGLLAPATWASVEPLPDGAPTFSVVNANVQYSNADMATAARALLALDADVVVVHEFTARMERALSNAGARERYPFFEGEAAPAAFSVGVYSRFPMTDVVNGPLDITYAVQATLRTPAGPVRMLAVHPVPPVHANVRAWWAPDLAAIHREALTSTLPTLVIGDFNATRWHPQFEELLDDFGNVHELLGQGLGTSWPINDDTIPVPFVRIDHALVRNGLTPVSISDFDTPGSDHRGFVVRLGVR